MKREAFPASLGIAIAELPADSRAALGWLRLLGPLDTKNLALALDIPAGAVFHMCRRLQRGGLAMSRSRAWTLSEIAAAWADQQDRDALPPAGGEANGEANPSQTARAGAREDRHNEETP